MFHMIELYQEWLTKEKLPEGMAAGDLLAEGVTEEQAEWLRAYITLWELSGF